MKVLLAHRLTPAAQAKIHPILKKAWKECLVLMISVWIVSYQMIVWIIFAVLLKITLSVLLAFKILKQT